jgi:hypothetical protein
VGGPHHLDARHDTGTEPAASQPVPPRLGRQLWLRGPATRPRRPSLARQSRPRLCDHPQREEILLADPPDFDPARDLTAGAGPPVRPIRVPPTWTMPGPGRAELVDLAVRYVECDTPPVRLHPLGSACDETACDYSRVRDSGELARLRELPSPIPGPQRPARKLDRGAPTASRGAAPSAAVRTVPRRALGSFWRRSPCRQRRPSRSSTPDRHWGPAGPVQLGSAAPADPLVAPPGPPREYRMAPSTVR